MSEVKSTAAARKMFQDLQKKDKSKMSKVSTRVKTGMTRTKMLGSIKKGTSLNKVQRPQEGLSRAAKKAFNRVRADKKGTSFIEKLDEEGLRFFNYVAALPFSQQAVAFLNAYWAEVNSQAEFIYSVSWDTFKYADMQARGINYVHLYKEGVNLEFDIGLYFYERLCRFLGDRKNKKWVDEKYAPSQPQLMTAIVRKKELRDKVDVNFDGAVSMLEYLLYQYREFANPADFVTRAMNTEEHPEIRKARLALEEVNRRIAAYEAEKTRLENESKKPGVRGLKAKNMLAQLGAGPLWEKLQVALITAEAAVRIATKKYGGKSYRAGDAKAGKGGAPAGGPNQGSIWWLNRDLKEKKEKYGRRGRK